MATNITTSTNTASDNITLVTNEDIFVAKDVVRSSINGRGIAALFESHAIDILGTIYGETIGLDLGASVAAYTFGIVSIGETGSVMAHSDAVLTRGSSVFVTNNGYIKGSRGLTHQGGGNFDFVNTGTVVGSHGTAVNIDSWSGHVVNYGIFIGQEVNSAVVLTNNAGGAAAPVLDNYGSIVGMSSSGAILGDTSARNTIKNFGQIHGEIDLGGGGDWVFNSGHIVGDLFLLGGADRYDGRTGNIAGSIYGGSGDDTILAGDEDNVILGGIGADTMAGGRGDDTYFVGDPSDAVIETAGEGNDEVQSTASIVLIGEVETLLLTGVSAINAVGSAFANGIVGNSAANTIDGGAGNDNIAGGAGLDMLLGGAGGDSLSGGTENDTLDGGADDDVLNGDAGIDTLFGSLGNDTLSGGTEDDRLDGGAGADILNGDSGFDTLFGGSDADSLFGGTENDALDGGADNDILNGDAGNDTLLGRMGNDRLFGGAGKDTLAGGAGIDVMNGGANADSFLFDTMLNKTTNIDRITDFSPVDDTILLDHTIFKKAGPLGTLKLATFFQGTKAHDASDRIIYNKATGAVFYDDDGTGAHAQVQFAVLTTKPTISFNDFAVF